MVLFIPTEILGTHAATCDHGVLVLTILALNTGDYSGYYYSKRLLVGAISRGHSNRLLSVIERHSYSENSLMSTVQHVSTVKIIDEYLVEA